MSWKRGLAVLAAAATVTTTGIKALEPMASHDNLQQQQQEQRQEQDSQNGHWQDSRAKQLREDGNNLQDQEMLDRSRPAEVRPVVPDEAPRFWVDP